MLSKKYPCWPSVSFFLIPLLNAGIKARYTPGSGWLFFCNEWINKMFIFLIVLSYWCRYTFVSLSGSAMMKCVFLYWYCFPFPLGPLRNWGCFYMVFGFRSFSVFNFKWGGLLTEVLCLFVCFLINLLQTIFSFIVCMCFFFMHFNGKIIFLCHIILCPKLSKSP